LETLKIIKTISHQSNTNPAMKINFRLNTQQEITQFHQMVAESGQTFSGMIRHILFSHASQPSAIDFDTYTSLTQIVSNLRKLADQTVPDDTNTELFTALNAAHELADRIAIDLHHQPKRIKK
jgi:hypothetical protein